ncbi:hypothetical protein [Actinophytocola sp.]|uniref:hypothetical protein n=1 Tax=Actinophytocola sp. TaxID=1872138 RepID=UPI00389B200E
MTHPYRSRGNPDAGAMAGLTGELKNIAAVAAFDNHVIVGQLIEIVDQLALQVQNHSLRLAIHQLRNQHAVLHTNTAASVQQAKQRWYPNG